MNRYRVAATYLLATCVVATSVFLPIYFLWYPGALFDQAGGRELVALIAGIDLVVGPMLIFIIYTPGKKGLAFDMAVIALVQATALAYGVYVLFQSRPVYIVFAKDRFELIRANDLDPAELEKAKPGPYASLPWTGPEVVAARIPKDPKEQMKLMDSALAGADIQTLPRYYVAYAQLAQDAVARSAPLARLRELNPGAGPAIDRLVARHGGAEEALRFLPMRAGPLVDLTVLMAGASGEVLEIAALRPWEFK